MVSILVSLNLRCADRYELNVNVCLRGFALVV